MRELTWAPGSAGVIDYILSDTGPAISAEARLVYLKLFSHLGDYDLCWPGVATLVQGTGLSERTVQRRLKELTTAGLVLCERRQGERTTYRLFPPWSPCQTDTPVTLTPLSDRHPRHADTPVRQTPPSESHQPPVTESPDPRHADTGTPVTLTPKVTHLSNPPKEPIEDPAAGAAVPPVPPEPGPDPPPVEAVNEDLMAGWLQVLRRLEAQLPKANFEAWLKPAVPVELRGRRLVLAVDTQFAADRLTARYGHMIRQQLKETTAGKITDFEVRVRGQPQP